MKLSIALTTYNHEKYIAKALDSIFYQKISYPFEIVIGNDCSTDNTQSIIENYKAKHPDIIKVLPRQSNLGYIKNFDYTMQACQGEYVAIFDGDDIMLKDKLMLQIAFLDSQQDCVIVGHDTRAFNSTSGETIRKITPPYKRERYTFEDLIKYGSFFANSSKMFRKSAYPHDGIDTNVKMIADWYVTLEIAKKGSIGYIHQTLVDYRIHTSSIMQKIKGQTHYEDKIYIIDKIREEFPNKYEHLFHRQLAYAHLAKGIQEFNEGQTRSSRASFIKAITYSPTYGVTLYARLLLSFFPAIYNIIFKRK